MHVYETPIYRVMWLYPYFIASYVLRRSTNVMDRQTDRQTDVTLIALARYAMLYSSKSRWQQRKDHWRYGSCVNWVPAGLLSSQRQSAVLLNGVMLRCSQIGQSSMCSGSRPNTSINAWPVTWSGMTGSVLDPLSWQMFTPDCQFNISTPTTTVGEILRQTLEIKYKSNCDMYI